MLYDHLLDIAYVYHNGVLSIHFAEKIETTQTTQIVFVGRGYSSLHIKRA